MKKHNLKRTFIKYVSLNVIGMMGLSCYILADTFFVAQGVGVQGLAALNLAIPIYSFLQGIGLMIGMGGATRFAMSQSDTVFTQALYYAGWMACLFLALGILVPHQLAVALGADAETLQNTSIYLQTILCFAPMFLLHNVVLCFVRNDGNPKLSMLAMLLGSFSNIVLDYVFIFPLQMGMFGAALATGIAPIVGLLVLSLHFIRRKNTFHFFGGSLVPKTLLTISSLGISALVAEVSSGVVIIVFNGIILRLAGNVGVAAYGIIANLALVILAIFTGIGQGMQPIISRCYSTDNQADSKKVLRYGFVTALSIAVLVFAVSFIFAIPMVNAFNKEANELLAHLAVKGLRLYFTSFVFVGINLLTATYFSAVGHAKNAFVISLLRGFFLIIPVVFLFSTLWGLPGVWVSMTCTELLVVPVSIHMLRQARQCEVNRTQQQSDDTRNAPSQK